MTRLITTTEDRHGNSHKGLFSESDLRQRDSHSAKPYDITKDGDDKATTILANTTTTKMCTYTTI